MTLTGLRSSQRLSGEKFNNSLYWLGEFLAAKSSIIAYTGLRSPRIRPAIVMFKELTISEKKYLLIVDRDGDDANKGMQLLVYTPTHSNFVGDWPSQNNFHFDEWSWEDLYKIGKLPIIGGIYDKVISFAVELTGWVTSFVKNRNKVFFDDGGKLSNSELCYFRSARSNYLGLHIEGNFLVEPHSLYRFARQFGFYQDIPQELKVDVCSTNHNKCPVLFRTLTRYKTYTLFLASPRDVQHKKSRGKELLNIIDSSKGSDTQEMKRKSSQSSRNVGKFSKKGTKGLLSLEFDIGEETHPKNTSHCLFSILVKGKESNILGYHEKKRDKSHVDDDEHSNNSD
ncbi:hypothetical protein ACH5RR_036786 [Cinchona calisaya]|uniref:Uncharacterized protein n=1 Tax=Cinchona calisaya TaxID=153742 RepID=A0ABD2Y8Z2_9GENT